MIYIENDPESVRSLGLPDPDPGAGGTSAQRPFKAGKCRPEGHPDH